MNLSRRSRKALRKIRKTASLNGLALYNPTPGQINFHRQPNRLRTLIAANQVGKTIAGGVEVWWLATEAHPYRPDHKNVQGEGWICVANWGKAYESVCKKLMETCPRHLIDWGKTTYHKHGHFVNSRITLLSGFVIKFVSSRGSSTSGASGSIDWLWIDEPPKRHQLGELLARTSSTSGPVFMTLTPCDSEQDLTWLQHYVEGDPDHDVDPTGNWSIERITYTIENLPWKTKAQVEEQTSLYPAWEYNQRVLGMWEGITASRRFVSFNEQIVVRDDVLPVDFDEIRVGIDHGEGTGKQVIHLIGVESGRYWVLGEYTAKAGHGLPDHIRGLLDLLSAYSLTVYHLDEVFGDINSAGMLGGGMKYNLFLEREIARQLQLTSSPITIRTPNKGRGSVAAGEAAMDHAMKEGRFFVHASCKALIYSMKHYTGKEQDLKDPVDSCRYSIADLLLSPRGTTDQVYVKG